MRKRAAVRRRLADFARDVADGLSVLQHLWAVAAASAVVTVGLGVVMVGFGVTVPSVFQPALGLVVTAVVSGIGYLAARSRLRQDLSEVSIAATSIVNDADLALGWDAARPSHRRLTIRDLAGAAARGDLADQLFVASAGSELSARLDEFREYFERKTSRHRRHLSPPRANKLVESIIRALSDSVGAAEAYERQRLDALSSGWQEQPIPAVAELGEVLVRVAQATDELFKIDDRLSARAFAESFTEAQAEAASVRGELQAAVAHAAQQLLKDAAPAPAALERSPLRRTEGGLREVALLSTFAFDGAIEIDALAEWRSRVNVAQAAFLAAVEGRGYEMHPRTHRAWTSTNDAARQLNNAIAALHSDLEHEPELPSVKPGDPPPLRAVDERRGDVLEKVRQLVERIDAAIAVEVP